MPDHVEQATAAPGEYRDTGLNIPAAVLAAKRLLEVCDGDVRKAIAMLEAVIDV